MKMTLPTAKDKFDVSITVKCLQVLQKVVELKPATLNDEQIKMLINLIHYPSQSVKEEVANFLLIISEEFDDANSLLEIQKYNP